MQLSIVPQPFPVSASAARPKLLYHPQQIRLDVIIDLIKRDFSSLNIPKVSWV